VTLLFYFPYRVLETEPFFAGHLSKIGLELVSTDAPMLQIKANKKQHSRAAI
jgi:hypothetical protein